MKKTYRNKIPTYLGWFIILAMLPQIVGFNGSVVDTLFKLALIIILTFLMINIDHITKVSRYFALFLMGSSIGVLGTLICNTGGIFNEIQSWIIELLLVYVLYECVLYIRVIRIEDIIRFYKIFVYFMMAASIYNTIIHFNSLVHITSLNVYNTEGICSFFDNKNTYGVFLLFGTLATVILKIILKQQRWSVISILFIVNELMAMCRTALVLSVVLIVSSFIVDRRTRFQGIVALILSICISIIIIRRSETISYFLIYTLFGNSTSLDARNDYLISMLPLVKGSQFWFGYGNLNATQLAIKYMGNAYYHNTYLKCLISGGMLKLALQVSAIVLSIKYGLRDRSYNKAVGNLCLLSTFMYVVYAFVESVVLFDTPVVAIMAVMFTISMPILFYNAFVYEKLFNLTE